METPIVFVVDDEPGIALLCNRLLTRAGYKVETQTNPREAISFLKENKIDLLLVDIRMPEVDGFEVIQHAQRLQPDAAMLIMTGHGTVETAIRALRQGVDGLILKPFSKGSELVDAVKLALADSQQKRDAARFFQLPNPCFLKRAASLCSTSSSVPFAGICIARTPRVINKMQTQRIFLCWLHAARNFLKNSLI